MIIEKEIESILNKKWSLLKKDLSIIENGKYPGIYLIAWSGKDLVNQNINLQDIFYVGMSNAQKGVSGRLRQFIKAIEGKRGHSGGNRFFHDFSNMTPYSKLNQDKRLYIITHSYQCIVDKPNRTGGDLRLMGDICRLEYYLIAHIKDKLGIEPELNKK